MNPISSELDQVNKTRTKRKVSYCCVLPDIVSKKIDALYYSKMNRIANELVLSFAKYFRYYITNGII